MTGQTSKLTDLRKLGLVSLCLSIYLLAATAPARAESDVRITYQGHMVSFKTTGSKEKLFGHYLIEVEWTESASVGVTALADYVLGEIPSLPQVSWKLESLTGKVHEDELGDPLPPEKECTATFSPRPGFTEQVSYTPGRTADDNVSLTLKAKAPFLVGSFMSSIEDESSFCSASAVHIDGKQAVGPPENAGAVYAEYLAAYEPSLTEPIDSTDRTIPFNYSYTFENPPMLTGEKSYVTVSSSISVNSSSITPPLTLHLPDGTPTEPASPIPLIEPPPYYRSPHFPPSTGGKGGPTSEEEKAPLELEPVLGSIEGWKLRCPKTLARCRAKAVLTAVLGTAAGGRAATASSRTLVIGGATLTVASGHVAGIDVRLTRAGLALLDARKRLRCTLSITATAPGLSKPASGRWTLELRRRPRR